MKRFLPASVRQFLWFVFKAPQRRMAGPGTIFTDLKGYLGLWFRTKQRLEPVSICTGLKNRSEAYLQYVVGSLKLAEHPELIELSVFDCGSDDVPALEQRIRSEWKGRLVFRSESLPFTRSYSFNKAIIQAGNALVMACDADISLPKDIVARINKYAGRGRAWFPIVNWLDRSGKGRFFTEGTGIFASEKEQFIQAGTYDESIKDWGKEDWILFFSFYKAGICPIRTREKALMHHWHESLKPSDFKPLF